MKVPFVPAVSLQVTIYIFLYIIYLTMEIGRMKKKNPCGKWMSFAGSVSLITSDEVKNMFFWLKLRQKIHFEELNIYLYKMCNHHFPVEGLRFKIKGSFEMKMCWNVIVTKLNYLTYHDYKFYYLFVLLLLLAACTNLRVHSVNRAWVVACVER